MTNKVKTQKPAANSNKKAPPSRKPGCWRGKVKMADDFDTLPTSMLNAFNP